MIAAVYITAESRSITVPSTVLSIYSSLYSSLYSSVPSTVLITVLTHCTRRIHSLIGMNYLSFCSSLQRCTHECSHYCTHHCTHHCTLITVDHCTRHYTRHCLQCPHHVLLFHAPCSLPIPCSMPVNCSLPIHADEVAVISRFSIKHLLLSTATPLHYTIRVRSNAFLLGRQKCVCVCYSIILLSIGSL
jgi:hypothetical protein